MIASIYKESGDTLTRLATAIVDENRQAIFIADADWEVTHYGVAQSINGPLMLSSLVSSVTVDVGNSLTIDLKNVTFEFRDTRAIFSYEVGQWMLN